MGDSPTPQPTTNVLVVEDSATVAELVRHSLESAGMSVRRAGDLVSARDCLGADEPDVIVLDLELPDGSGLTLLKELVTDVADPMPVVILSSHQTEDDRVLGLELGAEDYIVKPFLPRELATRVRRAASRGTSTAPGGRLVFDRLEIDLVAREVTLDGTQVVLATREFDLLAHLAAAPRRVFDRDELLRSVWESSPDWQTPRTITEHIRRLRLKVEDDPEAPRWIVTVRGSGYRFDP